MIYPHGGLPIKRHNNIRDITAIWLSEVCHDVEREPPLLPLTGEAILPQSANRRDDARADIRARGFWRRQQNAFFDVRVFYPNAPSYLHTSIPAMYRRHEQAKKREYCDRIREVEMASFTPLIFATTGGMGREATAFYKRLADGLAAKNNAAYSTTLAWMRCTLSFSLLRSAVMCIRGSRSTSHRVPDASLKATSPYICLCEHNFYFIIISILPTFPPVYHGFSCSLCFLKLKFEVHTCLVQDGVLPVIWMPPLYFWRTKEQRSGQIDHFFLPR